MKQRRMNMKVSKKALGILMLSLVFVLSACGNNNSTKENTHENHSNSSSHEEMEHSGSADVPEGLQESKNPKYKVGSQVIISTSHMKGMKGAEATVTGAYDTTAYVVSYTPTNGGQRVDHHKWVIQEEIKDAGDKTLTPGDQVILEASHMKGMKGATAEIDSAEKTTVYMVDYTSTTSGEKVKNHKWVTEDELSAKS
ncbi:YdhK family protein [Bacillus inaquosorum]|uniref:YdhK family protein n=1 Tax=Bacillus inaquosorum TaxID=483913 RepID=UPI00227E51DB|nr:YdhK family protein [Bacillus inaquosorum]MCY8769102.1 YdhK family protein [Bacillus inaquosorum]